MKNIPAAFATLSTLAIFLFVLFQGGNRSDSWTLFSIGIFTLVIAHFCLSPRFQERERLRILAHPVLVLALGLYVGVLLWSSLQALPDLAPTLAAPEWTYVDALPTISVDPAATWHGVLRLSIYAAVFWLSLNAALDKHRARRLVEAIAVWTSVVSIYALVAHFTGYNPILGADEAYVQLEGPFTNRNAFAFYACIGIVATFAVILQKITINRPSNFRSERASLRESLNLFFDGMVWLYLICAIFSISALLLTASRAGILSTAIAVTFFFVLYFRRRAVRARIIAIPAVLLALAMATYSSGPVLVRLFNHGVAADLRAPIYQSILSAISERPWVGYGLGTFRDAFRGYVPRGLGNEEWALAHNTYLENAMELGVPGAVALAASVLLLTSLCLYGALSRRRAVELPTFAVAVSVAAAVHSLVDFPLQMPATTALYALALGVGCAQALPSKKRSSGRNLAARFA